MAEVQERPNKMSIQTVMAMVALVMSILGGAIGYGIASGNAATRLDQLEEDVGKLQTESVALVALATRVVSVEGSINQLSKEQANGYARGLDREARTRDLEDRATKLEGKMENLLEGQNRMENMLARALGMPTAMNIEKELKK